MARITVFVAEGFEEIELIIPVDLWRRSGLQVQLVSLSGQLVRGSHGVELCCQDTLARYLALQPQDDLLFLPGGMPGSRHLAQSQPLLDLLRRQVEQRRWVAAICAAPVLVLGAAGLLVGQDFTCYPGMEQLALEGRYQNQQVVRSGWLITAAGAGAAVALSAEVMKLLQGEDAANQVLAATLFAAQVGG